MKNSGFEINRDPWPETLSAESTKHVRRVSLLNIRGPVCLGSGRTRICGPTSPLTSRSGKPRVRVRWSCEMLLNFSCLAPTKALYAMMLFDRYRRVHQGSSTQLTEHTVKTRQF